MTLLLRAVRQVLWHILAKPVAPPAWLEPREAVLFQTMPTADQTEALRVVDLLRRWGHGDDRELLLAGLLHDVGKRGAPAGIHLRVLSTMLDVGPPRLADALGRLSPGLDVLQRHAALGAGLGIEAGLPDGVVRLVRDHHRQPMVTEDPRLTLLRRADAAA